MATRPRERRRRLERDRLPGLRAAAQLLHRPASPAHPADLARAIAGAQAQDARAGRLSFRARSARLTAADVDRARGEERSLVRTWAMRSTMHLLAADDAHWLLPLFEPALIANSRKRLADYGLARAAQDRGLAEIARALGGDGPLVRDELVRRLERKRVRLGPETRFHLFRLATAEGIACLGPDVGAQTAFALQRDWLGERPPHDRDTALRELSRRYLGAFGPATEADFAGWAGLGLGDVRAGLRAIAGELRELRLDGETMWALRRPARRPRGGGVRLLPAWDTYLMGHRDRGFLATPADWRRIMPGGGVLRPAILVDGVAAGTWRSAVRGGTRRVELEPFASLPSGVVDAIGAEVDDLARFDGVRTTLA